MTTTETTWRIEFESGRDNWLISMESSDDMGLKVHAYGVFERMSDGSKIVPTSEREVLELAGLPWIEPEDRK